MIYYLVLIINYTFSIVYKRFLNSLSFCFQWFSLFFVTESIMGRYFFDTLKHSSKIRTMKKILLIAFIFSWKMILLGQDTYTLQIVNTQNLPLKNIEVTAVNSTKNVTVKTTTNTTGIAVFTLTEPGKYTFSYLEMKDAASYEKREGMTGFGEKKITYDPKKTFVVQPKVSRANMVFTTKTAQQQKGQPNMAKLDLIVHEPNEAYVPNLDVEVVDLIDKIKYKGKTNGIGICTFYIPINRRYEVDIAGKESLMNFEIPNFPNIQMEQTAYYEKTKVKEIAKGDTIVQSDITQTHGTSTHVLFTLTLKDYEDNLLNGENVYLKAQNKKRVYAGKTNEKGICKFMVEKGSDYLVNLKHEQNICLVEAPDNNSATTVTAQRRYRGSAVVERMIAEQIAERKRMEEQERLDKIAAETWEKERPAREAAAKKSEEYRLASEKEKERRINTGQFVPSFESTPIRKADIPSNYLTKTTNGYDLNFPSCGPIGTPTIAGDKLITKAGYYSNQLYCLQASTGQYIWGIEFGESGPSPAVLHNGVLLINTESCTLYAVDVATGTLLWSHWLSNYLYSTPTAIGNSVFAVYSYGGKPVLVSFDLRSGNFNWMKTVDDECIASPVADGNEIHLASKSGTYYVFNKDTGAPFLTSQAIRAVSSPTITETKIYLTAEVGGTEKLIELDRKTLKTNKIYTTPLTTIDNMNGNSLDGINGQMNYNGSHPIVYKNKVVIVTDNSSIIAFDALSEKLLWKQACQTTSNQIPIVANNTVIIGKTNGEVVSYDIFTGQPKILQKGKDSIDSQPICSNGFLYIAAAGVLHVVKSAQNIPWTQWNKDAGHNLYWRE